jgi:gliding motility associated protien GldN
MKKIIKCVKTVVCLLLLIPSVSMAQLGPQGYNPNSVRPIYEDDIMYRTTVWRRINLLEKQNKPFFSVENEIPRVIIEAVAEKKVQPYYPSSSPRSNGFGQVMEHGEFLAKMKYYDPNLDDSIAVRASELYIMEVKEDLIFDRRRSRMYWDIQSISMVIPQGATPDSQMGDMVMATFKYKELYEYFKATYDESLLKGTFEDLRAHWYNPENPKRHMSLGDAFDLRMFSSRIFKVSNPDDKDIITIVNDEYGDDPTAAKKVLYMSQKIEYDLMEYEHNLWEF